VLRGEHLPPSETGQRKGNKEGKEMVGYDKVGKKRRKRKEKMGSNRKKISNADAGKNQVGGGNNLAVEAEKERVPLLGRGTGKTSHKREK